MTRVATLGRAIVAASAIASATYACTIVNGLTASSSGGPDAAADGRADGVAFVPPDAGDGCPHRFPPPKPAPLAPGASGGNLELLAAISHIDLQDGEVGYDLDGLCTCGVHGPSCISPQVACDPRDGVDNVSGPLAVSLFGGADFQTRLNNLITVGNNTLLLGVQQYNGLPDDDQVTVSVYSAGTVYAQLDDGGFGRVAPKWDGTDRWSLDRAQLPTGKPPGSFDTTEGGYVSGGVLVAQIRVKERLNDQFELALTGGVMTAQIEVTDGVARLSHGVVAGRWPAVDMIRVFFELNDPLTGVPLCKDFLAEQVRSSICNAVDIAANPAADGTQAPCDALSMGMAFDTVPARFGPVLDVIPAPSECADAGISAACP